MKVHVRLGEEQYALPVEDVLEVTDLGEVTPLPGATRPFLGVRNLRGEVLPVIDLAQLIGAVGAGPPEHLVVAQAGALRAGLAVESVVGVLDLSGADMPTESTGLIRAVLVDDSLIGVVDVPAALATLTEAQAS